MPSREGLLRHLDETEGHKLRMRMLDRVWEAEPGDALAAVESWPFPMLAKLHGELHRLDREESARLGVVADTSAEGQVKSK